MLWWFSPPTRYTAPMWPQTDSTKLLKTTSQEGRAAPRDCLHKLCVLYGVQRIITHPSNQSHVPHHLRVEDIHQRCIQPKSSQHSQVCTIQRRAQLRWVPLGHVPHSATVFTGGSNDPASSRMVSR